MSEDDAGFVEDSLWFGSSRRPLFGRLALPVAAEARGGVLLSPPIGREARAARRALRGLAIALAQRGYVALRYDHAGTGDSAGSMDIEPFDELWVEGFADGVELLRSSGLDRVSVVGMRLGATIAGVAAARRELGLASAVLWDPCESGRRYLRELAALEALRRENFRVNLSGSVETSEFVFSDEAVARLGTLSLVSEGTQPIAGRVLVVAREDRVASDAFRERMARDGAQWEETAEQRALMEEELPSAVFPGHTIARIAEWLDEAPTANAFRPPGGPDAVVVWSDSSGAEVRESVMSLGPSRMFGVLCEPVRGASGPWVVLVNGINEDHVGPSRLWVELSRRWAAAGLRTLRFDQSELGESPWVPGQPTRPTYDRGRFGDVLEAVTALSSEDPSNSVLIGVCSGAQLALEVSLHLGSRGVCAINPQVGTSILRRTDSLEKSERGIVRAVALRIKRFIESHRWMGQMIWQVSRVVLPSAYSLKMRRDLLSHQTEILLLASADDLLPFPHVPILRSLDRRRMVSSPGCRVEIVPGMDHDMLSAVGRFRAMAILDAHVIEKFATAPESLAREIVTEGEL